VRDTLHFALWPGPRRKELRVTSGSLGGHLYQTLKLTVGYLWRVAGGWDLAEYSNDVCFPQLRGAGQLEKLRPLGEEDRPFLYFGFVECENTTTSPGESRLRTSCLQTPHESWPQNVHMA
jgi:hypothetical protein